LDRINPPALPVVGSGQDRVDRIKKPQGRPWGLAACRLPSLGFWGFFWDCVVRGFMIY